MIIEEPFPRFSLVISSANHIESIDPVVKENIIFNAKILLQLKTKGFIKAKRNNSISVLNNTVNISRTALTRIINDSIEEKWLFTKINKENKRQTLILPTELRVNFWLLYCKSKYEKSKLAGLADAHKALYHYDANIKNYLKKKK